MLKDASYHEAAIQYNGELAEFAEKLADRLKHPEVERWARSVAKQHRFHEGRHKKALDKIERQQTKSVDTEDGGEDRVLDDEHVVHRSAEDGKFVTAEEAKDNPSTTVEEHVSTSPVSTPDGPDASQAAQPVEN